MPKRPQRWQAELVADVGALLGEGPVWDDAAAVLYWVDIDRCEVHRFDPATGEDETADVGEPVGAVALRADGGLVLARKSGFATIGAWGAPPIDIVAVEQDNAATRMNDGACDRAGRFWAGTMHVELEPGHGSLYRLDPDSSITRVLTDVSISNGIAWSGDDRTMYYIDTPTGGIDAFDFDLATGTIGDRHRIVTIDSSDGWPDGLVVDSSGCLWVALWDGRAVRRYTADGELVGVVDVPVARVTKCAFGGPDLDEIYITTAAADQPDTTQPHAGGLFRACTGVRGTPANRFAG